MGLERKKVWSFPFSQMGDVMDIRLGSKVGRDEFSWCCCCFLVFPKVEMRIRTCLQLIHLEVYVQREPEAEKKLTQKDPSAYGVGPTRIPKLQTTQVSSEFIRDLSRGRYSLIWPKRLCAIEHGMIFRVFRNRVRSHGLVTVYKASL